MIRTFPTRPASGFTLIEVILVLALVVALLAGVGGLSERVLEHRASSRAWTRAQEVAEEVLGTLDRELSTCTIGSTASGPGVRGDATSIRVISRGVTVAEGDQIATQLRFDARRGEVEAFRGAVEGGGAQGPLSVIGGGIEAMRIKYRDRDEWVERFDSLAGPRLPLAVEVEIWFGVPGGASAAAGVDGGGSAAASSSVGGAPVVPSRPPDRVRTFAIPDAAEDAPAAGSVASAGRGGEGAAP